MPSGVRFEAPLVGPLRSAMRHVSGVLTPRCGHASAPLLGEVLPQPLLRAPFRACPLAPCVFVSPFDLNRSLGAQMLVAKSWINAAL